MAKLVLFINGSTIMDILWEENKIEHLLLRPYFIHHRLTGFFRIHFDF
jgi:hypothetical protein